MSIWIPVPELMLESHVEGAMAEFHSLGTKS